MNVSYFLVTVSVRTGSSCKQLHLRSNIFIAPKILNSYLFIADQSSLLYNKHKEIINIMNNMTFQTLGFVLSIVIAIVFAGTIKAKIQEKQEFNGIAWGLLNGVIGIGILWVIIAHASINKEIEKVKNKKYKEYAQKQMKDFVKTYGICLLVWIVISLILFATSMQR